MSGDEEQRNVLLSKQSLAPLIAGVAGGAVSTALLLPLDNIKVRLQVHEGERHGSNGSSTATTTANRGNRLGSFRILRGVIRHEGVVALYQGLTPAVVGSAVSWGGFFFVYEGMKHQLRLQKTSQGGGGGGEGNSTDVKLTSWDNFKLACASGAVMVLVTNPFWLIKLRMQLQMKKSSESLLTNQRPYEGMMDATRKIVQEEGILALYKGVVPALLLTSHGGVQFVVYEFLRQHFHYQRASNNKEEQSSLTIFQRLEKSFGYLMMGATSKMYVHREQQHQKKRSETTQKTFFFIPPPPFLCFCFRVFQF